MAERTEGSGAAFAPFTSASNGTEDAERRRQGDDLGRETARTDADRAVEAAERAVDKAKVQLDAAQDAARVARAERKGL